MNLLLLLSALLTALTGVSAGVRQPEVAQAVAMRESVVRAMPAAVRTVAARPLSPLATLVRSARLALFVIQAIAASTPLYASRRRE